MAVRLNDDKEMVAMIREGLKRTGGYCPCRLERTEENKCICKEFRERWKTPILRVSAIACCIIRTKKEISKFLKKVVDKSERVC